MSELITAFELTRNQKVESFIANLASRRKLEIDSQWYGVKSFYDSFDWRLYKAGMFCEFSQSKAGSLFTVADLRSNQLVASAEMDQAPVFAAQIQDPKLRSLVSPILQMRAFVSLSTLSLQAYRVNLLNKAEKTTVRLLIEEYELLPARIFVLPIRGYHNAAGKIADVLLDSSGVDPAKNTVLQASLVLQGRKPMDYSSRLNLRIDPEMRADQACKHVFRVLLRAIKANEPGAIAGTDSEFLHDLRVAVRRTRSGLNQLKEVFPRDVRDKHAGFFGWVARETGPCRDLDVYLLSFPDYRRSLPEDLRNNIDPLYDYLAGKQKEAQQQLTAKLRSDDYRSGIRQWDEFLKTPVNQKADALSAGKPIKGLVDERIWFLYQKVLTAGNRINPQSKAEALHDLRKNCKKLRYLMEFFQCFYAPKKIGGAIRELKTFQDMLGDFQDCEVQEQALKTFAQEMMAQNIPAETLLAMGALVENLHRKRNRARQAFSGRFKKFKKADNQARFQRLFAGKAN